MSITHCGRAIDELKRAGCFDIEKMKKGENGVDRLTPDDAEDVLNWSKYNIFGSLTRAGELLKDSSWTRLTTHKCYDFALIQSRSSADCERFHQKLREFIKAQASNKITFESLSKEAKERISRNVKRIVNDAMKELKAVYKIAKEDKDLKQTVEDIERETGQDKYDCIKKAFAQLHAHYGLSKNIVFDENADNATKDSEQQQESSDSSKAELALSVGMGAVWTCIGTGLAASGEFIGIGALMLCVCPGLPVLLAITATTVGIIAVSVSGYQEATAKKRTQMKLNDHLAKAIRKLNECEKYVEHQILRESKSNSSKAVVDKRVINLIVEFLNDQKNLWELYATAGARKYKKDDEIAENKHKSGSKIVSDEKGGRHGYQKRLGLTKQAVARTWCSLLDAAQRLYNEYDKRKNN